MLIPKQRLVNDNSDEEFHCSVKYSVYDTDNCAFVLNNVFGTYDSKEECQNAINFCNGFRIIS